VVLLRVIWRVVDIKIKETMPWHELSTESFKSEDMYHLDYVSSSIHSNIWTALKNQHWAVAISTTGQLVLLVSLVFVTGLFSLDKVAFSETNLPLRSNSFNGSAFDLNAVDPSSALLNLAIQTQNLSFPKGTSLDTVVPLFDAGVEVPINSSISALTKGLHVSLECEQLDVANASQRPLPWYSIRAPQFMINVTTPTCNITNARIGMGPNHGYIQDENATQAYQGSMRNYVCNSGLDYSFAWGRNETYCPSHCSDNPAYKQSLNRSLDDRLLVSVVDLHYTATQNTNIPTMWVNRLTAFLCKPAYSMNDYQVTYSKDSSGSTINLVSATNTTLVGFYPGDISKSLYRVFSDYQRLYIGTGGVDYQFTSDVIHPFFQMLTLLHGGEKTNFTLKDLIDPDVLRSSAEAMLKGTMTQIFHRNVLSAISDVPNTDLLGTVWYEKDRLRVKSLSTGLLCAGFGLLSIFTLALLFTIPQKPKMKFALGSTLAVALALKLNPHLIAQIQRIAHDREKNSEQRHEAASLEHASRSRPDTSPDSRVKSLPSQYSPIADLDADQGKTSTWWHPASSRDWFLSLAVLFCIIIIGLLEIIQHLSDTRDGFMNVASTALGSTVLTQYIPTAVVLGVALMFSDIEMNTATFSPFTSLKKGKAPAARSVSAEYHSKSGTHAFILSIVNGHFALSFMLASTFVASFLTIIVPGLYSQHMSPSITAQAVTIGDQFEYTNVDIHEDDKRAGTLLNLITYYDIEYPEWTYDDLAIPHIHTAGADTKNHRGKNSTGSTLLVRTNATRAKIDCQQVEPHLNWRVESLYPNMVDITASSYMPWSLCSDPPSDSNLTKSTPWCVDANLAGFRSVLTYSFCFWIHADFRCCF
jgi:hypothetical protein